VPQSVAVRLLGLLARRRARGCERRAAHNGALRELRAAGCELRAPRSGAHVRVCPAPGCALHGQLVLHCAAPTSSEARKPCAAARAPPEPVHTHQTQAGVCPCPALRRAQPRRARGAAPKRRCTADKRHTFKEQPAASRERARRCPEPKPFAVPNWDYTTTALSNNISTVKALLTNTLRGRAHRILNTEMAICAALPGTVCVRIGLAMRAVLRDYIAPALHLVSSTSVGFTFDISERKYMAALLQVLMHMSSCLWPDDIYRELQTADEIARMTKTRRTLMLQRTASMSSGRAGRMNWRRCGCPLSKPAESAAAAVAQTVTVC